jgi:alkylhydroperoxidase family enzyme
VRSAAAAGEGVPAALQPWVTKVRDRAYATTDDEFDGLRSAGYSEDEIFDATVAAALGAGLARFEAGVRALG